MCAYFSSESIIPPPPIRGISPRELEVKATPSPNLSIFRTPQPAALLRRSIFNEPDRFMLNPDPECSFCCTVSKRALSQGRDIPSYCVKSKDVCGRCRKVMEIEGSVIQNNYALSLFQNMVIDLEFQEIYEKFFKKFDFYFNSGRITNEQYIEVTRSFTFYREQFDFFISNVVNRGYYRPPNSDENIYLRTSKDWADCIRVLQVYLIDAPNEAFRLKLQEFDSPAQNEFLKKYCAEKGYSKCQKPCNRVKGWIYNSCEYKGQ